MGQYRRGGAAHCPHVPCSANPIPFATKNPLHVTRGVEQARVAGALMPHLCILVKPGKKT